MKAFGFMVTNYILFALYEGIFQSFDLTPASVHDINYLKDIKQQLSDCVILGDKGYLSSEIQTDLLSSVNIQLEAPKRINQKDYKPQFYLLKKYRKRIETLFLKLFITLLFFV